MWKSIVQKVGDFQIKIFFLFFYYVLITPLGFIATAFRDYLARREAPRWHHLEGSFENISDLKEQS